MLSVLVLFSFTISLVSNQWCINKNSQKVDWWVQLIFPKTVSGQYAYFDSKFLNKSFLAQSEPADSSSTAFYKTLLQINTNDLQYTAWNDQLPNGTTSSVKAHSKGILVFDRNAANGFYFGHSIPQFPDFIDKKVKLQIGQGQKTYAQHAFCISLKGDILKSMMNKILPMRAFIYSTNVQSYGSILTEIDPPDYNSLFSYGKYEENKQKYLFIYKNGALNGSLFEDGLNKMLNSALLVKSWGRPIEEPWCGSILTVGNVDLVRINDLSFWKHTQDHSKWAFPLQTNYSCFGDANRMTSQWKRGGAFYCIESVNLKQAMRSIINQTNTCHYFSFELYSMALSIAAAVIIILV